MTELFRRDDGSYGFKPLVVFMSCTAPELAPELEHVVNAFDPWTRDRDGYYSLQWKSRPGAETDEAFTGAK
jgi:hypothetical protein